MEFKPITIKKCLIYINKTYNFFSRENINGSCAICVKILVWWRFQSIAIVHSKFLHQFMSYSSMPNM